PPTLLERADNVLESRESIEIRVLVSRDEWQRDATVQSQLWTNSPGSCRASSRSKMCVWEMCSVSSETLSGSASGDGTCLLNLTNQDLSIGDQPSRFSKREELAFSAEQRTVSKEHSAISACRPRSENAAIAGGDGCLRCCQWHPRLSADISAV